MQQARNGRLGRHSGIDHTLPHGRDESRSRSDRHEPHVSGLHPVCRHEVLREKVRGRPQPGHTQGVALEVSGRANRIGLARRNDFCLTRGLTELDHGLHKFAFRLQVDRVIVEADDSVHGTRQQLILGVDAGRIAEQSTLRPCSLKYPRRSASAAGR